MEKKPEFTIRIIGKELSDKDRGDIIEATHQSRFNHLESMSRLSREILQEGELPKRRNEILLINFANDEVGYLLKGARVESDAVPLENFHIIRPELYKKIQSKDDGELACTIYPMQAIFCNAEKFRKKSLSHRGMIAFHETLHLQAHYALEASKIRTLEEDGTIGLRFFTTVYRAGLSVYASQKDRKRGKHHRHFEGLHEAILAEAERKFFPKLLGLPLLKKEKEWLMSDEVQQRKKEAAYRYGVPEDSIFWIDPDPQKTIFMFAYPKQRHVLNYICDEIQKEFPDRFQSSDDVYKVFLNAHFTGRLIEISKLVDSTFGEGGFRILGNMGKDDESAILHLEAMEDFRKRQLRQRKEASS